MKAKSSHAYTKEAGRLPPPRQPTTPSAETAATLPKIGGELKQPPLLRQEGS